MVEAIFGAITWRVGCMEVGIKGREGVVRVDFKEKWSVGEIAM